MARRSISESSRIFIIADDDPAPGDLLNWAILRCRVVDELTLDAPVVPVAISTHSSGLVPRSAAGGICGLVGRPRQAATELIQAGALEAVIEARGYLPRDLTPAIDAARRILDAAAAAGSTDLSVTPAESTPRRQFIAGRGVMLERAVPTEPDQFAIVAASGPPPSNVVPLTNAVSPARPIGARLAGVPIVLPDQPLHRSDTVTLRGRVQLQSSATTLVPATGATVTLTGVWWDYPATIATPPRAPELCAVDPPLRFSYPENSPVDSCTLTPVGPSTSLHEPAQVGQRTLLIAADPGLSATGDDLLQLGDPLTGEDEVVITASCDVASTPVLVQLRTPTGCLHRAGAIVQQVQASAVASVGSTLRESQEGDRVLFAPGLAILATTGPLILGRTTPRESYHRATQYPVAATHLVPLDADGRFAWPQIARVAQVRIRVQRPPSPDAQLDVALDYASDPSVSVILT